MGKFVEDFGGKPGTKDYNNAVKFFVDSAVTICNDLETTTFSFNKYCEVREFYDWIKEASEK